MRQLTETELERLKFLSSNDLEVALIEPTLNGLTKSILDATQSLRLLLKTSNLHDFDSQAQGPENKIKIEGHFLTDREEKGTTVSVYRPITKKGDPRIWFSGLASFCSPNNILAIAVFNQKLWILNLSSTDISHAYASGGSIKEFLNSTSASKNTIASELLDLLKVISRKGFISSSVNADTAIGRLLEQELNIPINSSKNPDYKGIEIKSFRSERHNRMNLFAQVPNWNLSKFKSSKEILDAFGYDREGVKKLYCTVNASKYNSQGLKLKINHKEDFLIEESQQVQYGEFIVWELTKLRARLLEKHAETFWVSANSKIQDGHEFFHFTNVEHTKGPLLTNFEILIETGGISLDHLIKEKGMSVVEKGPIFKLSPSSFDILFPPSVSYNLT
jgi:hypothetical protein